MLHQAMLFNASFDVENRENRLLFVPFSKTAKRQVRITILIKFAKIKNFVVFFGITFLCLSITFPTFNCSQNLMIVDIIDIWSQV